MSKQILNIKILWLPTLFCGLMLILAGCSTKVSNIKPASAVPIDQIEGSSLNPCDIDKKYPRYKKSHYPHWVDADRNGLDTRHEVLLRDSVSNSFIKNIRRSKRRVTDGYWVDPYTEEETDNPNRVKIVHLIPLYEAHHSGAVFWDRKRKQNYANDLNNPAALVAVLSGSSKGKGNKDPAGWLPEDEGLHCQYIADWVDIKSKWNLCYDEEERQEVIRILESCN